MEWPPVKALLWAFVVFLQIREHRGCFEEERIGLLELKAFLVSNTPADYQLPLWSDDAKSDCCGWERVRCNSNTGRTIELSLGQTKQDPSNYFAPYYNGTGYEERWLLNVSLFMPFTELTSLDLSCNGIGGCLPNEGFGKLSHLRNLRILNLGYNFFDDNSILQSFTEVVSLETLNLTHNRLDGHFPTQGSKRLSRLKNLTTMDLSGNKFDRSIIKSLSSSKSIKILNLASNWFRGSFPTQELSYLDNLEQLDLTWNLMDGLLTVKDVVAVNRLKVLILKSNMFDGPLPIIGLANFSRLEILDLTGNFFTGSISPSIGTLSSLKSLSLAFNHLTGTLPAKELCGLTKLEELDLTANLFKGNLPPCLNNMTSLRYLDISRNQFSGNISSIGLTSPKSLEYIDFSGNDFEGIFPFSLFANHSKLQVIKFQGEVNMIEIETENPMGWEPLFQLKVLLLSNCRLNELTGKLPTFLFGQHKLEIVDLSHNQLKGSFPTWLLKKNIRLQLLRLRNNSLVGKFHLPPYHYPISLMDVSDNHLDGQLHKDLGKLPLKLRILNLSRNHFEGYLPSLIGEECSLEILDLSFNNFSGDLPRELVKQDCPVSVIKLNNNRLTGPIPTSLSHSKPYYLDFSNNTMNGMIPGWIGNTTREGYFFMSNNLFHGQIPCNLGSVVSLDLAHNLLSGSLPPSLNLRSIRHLRLQGNKLTGPLPKSMFNSLLFSTLDLRNNNFFGRIPNEVGNLSYLRILLLRGNLLSGTIPNRICWLTHLDIMDLSMNSLSGAIPNCFNNMSFGEAAVNGPFYNPYPSSVKIYGIDCSYQRLREWDTTTNFKMEFPEEIVDVGFVTKYRSYSYSGRVLYLMSGLDLSCNNLIGRIPLALVELTLIVAVNLSYNQLRGTIPGKISNLAYLESLDLSHNHLSGEIPLMLMDMHFLEVFSVAYNNLSGRVPDMKAQFSTFDKRSYEGNPFLCGAPLENICTILNNSYTSPTKSSSTNEEKWYNVDPRVFFPSFIVSYIIFFLCVTSLLYINPYWQQQCVNWVEGVKYWFYYVVFHSLTRCINHLYH